MPDKNALEEVLGKAIGKDRLVLKRSRTSVACIPCKSAKTKCSEFRPCKQCTSSGTPGRCIDNRGRTASENLNNTNNSPVGWNSGYITEKYKESHTQFSHGIIRGFDGSRIPQTKSFEDPPYSRNETAFTLDSQLNPTNSANLSWRPFQLAEIEDNRPVTSGFTCSLFSPSDEAHELQPPKTIVLPPIRQLLSRPPPPLQQPAMHPSFSFPQDPNLALQMLIATALSSAPLLPPHYF